MAHIRGRKEIIMSSLILEENDNRKQEEIVDMLKDALGVKTVTIFRRLPITADGTGHIDMWLTVLNDTDIIVSEFPYGTNGYQETELGARDLIARGYRVHRLPAMIVGNAGMDGIHYTYTNVLIANSIVVVPQYFLPTDDVALATWQRLMPKHKIYQLDSRSIISERGAIHCITAHVFGVLSPSDDYQGDEPTVPQVPLQALPGSLATQQRLRTQPQMYPYQVAQSSRSVPTLLNSGFQQQAQPVTVGGGLGAGGFNYLSIPTANLNNLRSATLASRAGLGWSWANNN
jgi:hypothetical protein